MLTLRYVCELPLEPDGAARYVLLIVLHPRYTPHGWDGEDVTQGVLRVPQRELPYTLSLSATLKSPHGIKRVLSNCPLTSLSYTAGNRTTAQVSQAQAPPWDRDLELLVYYVEPHKPSVVLEAGLPGAKRDFIKEYMEMIDCVSIREVSIDRMYEQPASRVLLDEPNYRNVFGHLSHDLHTAQLAPEESPLLRLVSLQNANDSWDLDPRLAAVLGVSETDARERIPREDITPSIWATVLAVVWLHDRAIGQCDEWELLEAKAVGWVRDQAGAWLSECLEAANALLGCSVGPAVFWL